MCCLVIKEDVIAGKSLLRKNNKTHLDCNLTPWIVFLHQLSPELVIIYLFIRRNRLLDINTEWI